MEFFLNSEIPMNDKLLELMFIVMGLLCIYLALKHLRSWRGFASFEAFLFWFLLGVVLAAGRWLPSYITGILILIMTLPAIQRKSQPFTGVAKKIKFDPQLFQGNKIFIPALSIGTVAILCSFFTDISSLVGIGIGVVLAMFILFIFSRKNTPRVFLRDGANMLETIGPLSMLPMLLASLGAIYTEAGVGVTIAEIMQNMVPKGNVYAGMILLSIGMIIFTMIMGNSFASITVMLVGIGYPFVLSYGVDPVIGMIALSIGSCGTLMTPMAANFNIVPVNILEMKDKYGVIKNQIVVSLAMFVCQLLYLFMFI